MGENPLFLKSKVKVMEISQEMRTAVKPASFGAVGGAIALRDHRVYVGRLGNRWPGKNAGRRRRHRCARANLRG